MKVKPLTFYITGQSSNSSVRMSFTACVTTPKIPSFSSAVSGSDPDPIVIKKASTAFISHCALEYRGWVWIALASGKAGWAPQQIFTPLSANEVVCLEDYTAHELSVRSGERITVMKSLNGCEFNRWMQHIG